MSRQLAELSEQLPQIAQRVVRAFPPAAPILQWVGGGPQKMASAQMRTWFERGLDAGKFAVEGLAAVIFVLVVAVYLVAEGRQAFEWLVTFAPPWKRNRVRQTAHEMNGVVLAYMRGNVITSIICGVYVFAVLTALRVPVP